MTQIHTVEAVNLKDETSRLPGWLVNCWLPGWRAITTLFSIHSESEKMREISETIKVNHTELKTRVVALYQSAGKVLGSQNKQAMQTGYVKQAQHRFLDPMSTLIMPSIVEDVKKAIVIVKILQQLLASVRTRPLVYGGSLYADP